MNKIIVKDENGTNIDISVIGFFKVPQLEKEYVIYAFVDDNFENSNGSVLFGEVVRSENDIQILGILSEEKEMVIACYEEISNQIGGIENEG